MGEVTGHVQLRTPASFHSKMVERKLDSLITILLGHVIMFK
jgi:hypothetical protein